MREHRLREAQRLHSKEWRKKNPDYVRLKSREYREKNPEYHRQKCREWRQKNLDYRRQYQREWRQKNPDYQRRRRLLKKTEATEPLLAVNASERQEIFEQTELRQSSTISNASNNCSGQNSSLNNNNNVSLTLPNRTSDCFEHLQPSANFLNELHAKRERGKHKNVCNNSNVPSLHAPSTLFHHQHHHAIHKDVALGIVVPSLDLWCPAFPRVPVAPAFHVAHQKSQ